jgi:hypothetical protein
LDTRARAVDEFGLASAWTDEAELKVSSCCCTTSSRSGVLQALVPALDLAPSVWSAKLLARAEGP